MSVISGECNRLSYLNHFIHRDRCAADASVSENGQAAIYQIKTGESRIALPVWRGKQLKIVHRKIVLLKKGQFIIQKKTIPLFDSLVSSWYSKWNLKEIHGKRIEDRSITARLYKKIVWISNRVKEIPFLLTHPKVLVQKFYRVRVRNAMANQTPEKVKVKLSKILPAHPLLGNSVAEERNKKRIEALRRNKHRFDELLRVHQPITQEVIDSHMDSSSPLQLAFDAEGGKCIAFDGNSRLIAIKRFFSEAYPGQDPEIEVAVYRVNSKLMRPSMPERDYSIEPRSAAVAPS